jgi:hypothetical protein
MAISVPSVSLWFYWRYAPHNDLAFFAYPPRPSR